ncbi:ABC transporter ATP-binding protein [Ahrensia kielensis]|uniref:ABC transporter ATP-binding protein n=1 Tax=Ahrensia kielensis TaxID=76980 RepID=UPI001FDF0365|nr:oligopeptide/dipeptide ABC transporter ATP-binding protein [Ahrensia kielensis]
MSRLGGEVRYHGQNILDLPKAGMQKLRRHIQVVFQDPYSSLDPRFTVRRILSEPWQVFPEIVSPEKREARVAELLSLVGLNPSDADRYPHQFSGGQRQRIGIARALALEPEVIVCDEAVSALDVSVQAQVVNLLKNLQDKLGLAYLFIAHDLSVVRHISDRVIVMYLGQVVEEGPPDEVFRNPKHPYTVALLSAVPLPDPKRRNREVIVLEGEVLNPIFPPSGCPFHPRCSNARDICRSTPPPVRKIGEISARCHFAGEMDMVGKCRRSNTKVERKRFESRRGWHRTGSVQNLVISVANFALETDRNLSRLLPRVDGFHLAKRPAHCRATPTVASHWLAIRMGLARTALCPAFSKLGRAILAIKPKHLSMSHMACASKP